MKNYLIVLIGVSPAGLPVFTYMSEFKDLLSAAAELVHIREMNPGEIFELMAVLS